MSKKGKNNKGQENRSRHQRDLEALSDARLRQAQALGDKSFVPPSKEIVVCTIENSVLPSLTPGDPLEQLRRDVAENRPTAPEIRQRLLSPDITGVDVISAIREGNRRRRNQFLQQWGRGKEQHI